MAKDYRFFLEGKEKDPIIHQLMTRAQKQGNLSPEHLERISVKSGVSVGTIRAWWFGDTRRPHFLTIRFVAEALDCRIALVSNDDPQPATKKRKN